MGYLVCQKCRGYYEFQTGELPSDFTDKCTCGGKLRYSHSIDVVGQNTTFKTKKKNTEQSQDNNKKTEKKWFNRRERPVLSNIEYIKENRNFNSGVLVVGSLLGAYYFSYLFLIGLILAVLQFYTISWLLQVTIIFYLIIFGFLALFTGIISLNFILIIAGGLILLNALLDVWIYKGVRDKEMGLK